MVDNVFGTRSGNTAIFPQSDGNQAFIDWEALFSKDGQIPALAKQARLPQSDNAKSTANSGLLDLTTADAKPCATCDTNQAYSLAFQVMDGSPDKCRPCAGMYYTVYFKLGSYPPDKGQTDENGLTARYFCSNPAEEIYLYIGHREKEDGYPTSRDTDEHKYDEAPLWNAQVALVAEKKVIEAKTQRLWKPWAISKEGEDFTSSYEGLVRNQYDIDSNEARADPSKRNVTIGIGKLVHNGQFVMNQARVDQTVEYLRQNNTPVTPENLSQAVGPATGLTGTNLTNAQAEMRYVNGLTTNEAEDLFNKTTYPEHRRRLEKDVHVPLYQHEYDALADLAYNRGPGTVYNGRDAKRNQPNKQYGTWLDRGRYHYVGDVLVRNNARGRVPDRRDAESNLFLNGIYSDGNAARSDYQPGNKTPWKHVQLD